MRRHGLYSGNYSGVFVAPKNTQNAETKHQSGAVPILLLALLAWMTSAYSSLGVLQGLNPQRQLLEHQSTTWPHQPDATETCKGGRGHGGNCLGVDTVPLPCCGRAGKVSKKMFSWSSLSATSLKTVFFCKYGHRCGASLGGLKTS